MDISFFREALDYNPETGKILWAMRPKHHFKTTKGYNLWKGRYAGTPAGSYTRKGHLRIPIDGTLYYGHRLAWALHYGQFPNGQIDHINGNPADNRIENLRVTDSMGNARNQRLGRNNKTGFHGLVWWEDRQKWQACIGVGSKSAKSLGFYETKDEAIAARRGAEIVLGYHKNHGRRAS